MISPELSAIIAVAGLVILIGLLIIALHTWREDHRPIYDLDDSADWCWPEEWNNSSSSEKKE